MRREIQLGKADEGGGAGAVQGKGARKNAVNRVSMVKLAVFKLKPSSHCLSKI